MAITPNTEGREMTTQTANKIYRLARAAARNGWTTTRGVTTAEQRGYGSDCEWVEIATDADARAFVYVEDGVTAGVEVGGNRRFISLASLIRRAEAGRLDMEVAA
jgi:hypothetical protein